jgi:trehalose synthase
MIPKLEYYRKIVGPEMIAAIREAALPLSGKSVVHMNATAAGGGVAEILNTLVFLMNDLGIKTGWRVMIGSHSFFKITKGMHNSLQGQAWKMTESRQRIYQEYCRRNATINHIGKHDFVIIHDPQPLGMIKEYERTGTWLWRCHIDLSTPGTSTMQFILPYIGMYDGIIVSDEKFQISGLEKPQYVIPPSIDPLSVKNKPLGHGMAVRILASKGINLDRPLITQVSRFDPWKGQLEVIQIYKELRKRHQCQLVLIGDMAGDDPQGPMVYHKIMRIADKVPGLHVMTEKNDLLVNALQRESAIVFQNSKKEGFGLTVSEALYKSTPVIARPVGGIPLQVQNGNNGFLINNVKEGVERASLLLSDPDLRSKMGKAGHEHVKKNFLITRQLLDYIKVMGRYL